MSVELNQRAQCTYILRALIIFSQYLEKSALKQKNEENEIYLFCNLLSNESNYRFLKKKILKNSKNGPIG